MMTKPICSSSLRSLVLGAKREICYSFAKANIHLLIAELLGEVKISHKQQKAKNLLRESVEISTGSQSNEKEEPLEVRDTRDTLKKAQAENPETLGNRNMTTSETMLHGMISRQSLFTSGSTTLEGNPLSPSTDLRCRLRRQEDLMVDQSCDENDPRLDDQSKLLAMQVVWLCSWAYEDVSKTKSHEVSSPELVNDQQY